jgi:hypothetical protein
MVRSGFEPSMQVSAPAQLSFECFGSNREGWLSHTTASCVRSQCYEAFPANQAPRNESHPIRQTQVLLDRLLELGESLTPPHVKPSIPLGAKMHRGRVRSRRTNMFLMRWTKTHQRESLCTRYTLQSSSQPQASSAPRRYCPRAPASQDNLVLTSRRRFAPATMPAIPLVMLRASRAWSTAPFFPRPEVKARPRQPSRRMVKKSMLRNVRNRRTNLRAPRKIAASLDLCESDA